MMNNDDTKLQAPADQPVVGGTICHEPIPDIFIDGVQGAVAHGGAVRINLYCHRLDPETNKMNRIVVGRLVVPVGQFPSMADAFSALSARLRGSST